LFVGTDFLSSPCSPIKPKEQENQCLASEMLHEKVNEPLSVFLAQLLQLGSNYKVMGKLGHVTIIRWMVGKGGGGTALD